MGANSTPQARWFEALLLIDIQNDFIPGGSLGVPHGEAVVPVANALAAAFAAHDITVAASRDFHPERTVHFQEFGGRWPKHCVIGTSGASFHPDLDLPDSTLVVSNGMDPERDAYSAFEGVSDDGHDLDALLRSRQVERLYVLGLATDYCVRWSVDDALRRGYQVFLVEDGIRGVDIQPGDSQANIEAMVAAGATLVESAEVLAVLNAM